uniref:F-box domain-containing protein n=1 Tax=Strongyloides papillosus TaxID=174720 RepID=A0A0N5CCW0_STREA
MDSDSDEKYSEAESNIFVLPNDVFSLILPKLSRKDILNLRCVSRSFYNIIHENYHLLNKERIYLISIEYDENDESNPLRLEIFLDNMANRTFGSLSIFVHWVIVLKTINIQNSEELSRFLKIFDLRNFHSLKVRAADNINIFAILNKSFETGTNIETLLIQKLKEKDFESFRTFVEKLSSVRSLSIEHICAPSTRPRDVYSLLSLSSLNTIKDFDISECDGTKILSSDIVAKLFRNNPDIEFLTIRSMNIEFLESVFKEFFTVEQPRKMESECNFSEIDLNIYFNGEFEYLIDILRNDLSELDNVMEITKTLASSEFKSDADCKNCRNKKHKITRYVYLFDTSHCNEELNH